MTMLRSHEEVLRWKELLEIERAAKDVANATIRTHDHTKWFPALARLLGVLGYPDKWKPDNG